MPRQKVPSHPLSCRLGKGSVPSQVIGWIYRFWNPQDSTVVVWHHWKESMLLFVTEKKGDTVLVDWVQSPSWIANSPLANQDRVQVMTKHSESGDSAATTTVSAKKRYQNCSFPKWLRPKSNSWHSEILYLRIALLFRQAIAAGAGFLTMLAASEVHP